MEDFTKRRGRAALRTGVDALPLPAAQRGDWGVRRAEAMEGASLAPTMAAGPEQYGE